MAVSRKGRSLMISLSVNRRRYVQTHAQHPVFVPQTFRTDSYLPVATMRFDNRRTWNYPELAQVLASCANYMICDDHEIVDDLGE